ncbi:MAG: ABC-F family ATP-binding cassette domain-containing protein [Actinomycetota bacterium]
MAVNLVNLESITVTYGTRRVLDDLSLGVARGERIGVVGRNGGGKTTLLRVLARDLEPDAGRVTHTGGLRVGLLRQRDGLDPAATVRASVVGDRPEHEWASDPRVREVLGNLLAAVPFDAAVGTLSGGERRRVALARLLIRDDDLLLLDEPTNHLDIEVIDWLGGHLAGSGRSHVVVSHDRWLLDTGCEAVWEVVDGRVEQYEGGYSAYVLARAERERLAAAAAARRSNLLRKELAWLRRGPPARTSKPKFRVEAANALIADEPPPRDPYELARFAAARLGKDVYDVDNATVEIAGRRVLDGVTWRLGPGDRVGLVGPNGSGKTTLLRLLTGDVQPDGGRVRAGRTVRPAMLGQEITELDRDTRVLEAVEEVRRSVRIGRGEQTAGQLLERFGFRGERQRARVGDLSGGERRRLQLLRLLLDEPNVLLLDEPTNDLDIETLTVIEDLLDSWAGTLVVVSHDRWFLERVTDAVWATFGDGALTHLPGGIDEYVRRRRAAAEGSGRRGGGTTARRPGRGTRTARKELARIERDVDRLHRREQRLHEELAAYATDADKVFELDSELRGLQAQRDELETRWLELADEVDNRA